MRTLSTALALAVGVMSWAQTGPATPDQQQTPVPYVKSTYHDCLTMAGTNTWQAMGLNSEQIARVSDIQTRYKQAGLADAEAKAKAEEKAAKEAKKSGKKKRADASSKATSTQLPATAPTSENASTKTARQQEREHANINATDKGTALDPATEGQATLEKNEQGTMTDASLSLQPVSPYDDELRSILTPEQMHLWERRCDVRTSMQP